MTNAQCVLVYSPFLLINSILLADILAKDRSKSLVRSMLVCYAGLLGWLLLEACIYLVPESWQMRYVFDLKLIFVSVVAVAIFSMFLFFYRLDRLFPKWLIPALCVLPTITSVLAVTTPLHNLLVAGWEVVQRSPLITVLYVRGLWYWVHTAYCQLLFITVMLLLIQKRNELPKGYRGSSSYMILGIAIYLMLTAVETFNLDKNILDFTLIGANIGTLFCYLAITIHRRPNYLHIEQTEIFNLLDQAVFILDQNGFAIDANTSGHRWLALLDHGLENRRFDSLIEQLYSEGKIGFSRAGEHGTQDIFIPGAQLPIFYHTTYRQLGTQADTSSGTVAILTNVTENRLSIERLRDLAGIDDLTGLPNRNRYQTLLRTLDKDENLPLSIILGDANGLKAINDTLGHDKGDLLLQNIARALERHCPPGGYVARIGGDEFAMLLPNCPAGDADAGMAAIRRTLRDLPEPTPHAVVALGRATKTLPEENLSSLIREADMNMYADKRE